MGFAAENCMTENSQKTAQIQTVRTGAPGQELPLSYARTLSWLSLVLVLLTNLGLSFFISNSARETLLTKQKEFGHLLVENLNNQIFRRFALPTILARGRIALRQPTQYEHLDRVVKSVIQGLPVARLRIYDFSYLVAYSTAVEDLGRAGLSSPKLEQILHGGETFSTILSSFPSWQAPFRLPLKPGTFLLRILAPLQGEPLPGQQDIPIMGALELTQDITEDYERVLAFQGIIVGLCLLSSVILFTLLLILIHRAERVLSERMHKNLMLEKEIHSNEKLVSMGRVVASIAHEIRNPLGIIRSSAELLQKRAEKTDRSTARILGAIYDESVRLSQTVNDFLDYARPRKPRQDLVDLHIVLDQVLLFLESEFSQRNLTVEKDVPADPLFIYGDKDLLYRAFYNIFVNGAQAMEGEGTFYIHGEFQKTADTEWISIAVRDTAKGFDPASLDQVLDPFFTTKEGGTGLGLPIVHSIVTSHEGKLTLKNAPEGGACVCLLFPKAKLALENE